MPACWNSSCIRGSRKLPLRWPPGFAILPKQMANAIRILGLDPGLRRTGWGVVAVEGAAVVPTAVQRGAALNSQGGPQVQTQPDVAVVAAIREIRRAWRRLRAGRTGALAGHSISLMLSVVVTS